MAVPEILRGSQILRWDVKYLLKLVPHFGVNVRALLGVDRGWSLVVPLGGDCRCEVLLQSYSPSNVVLGLQNVNFWGVLGDFSVREALAPWTRALALERLENWTS